MRMWKGKRSLVIALCFLSWFVLSIIMVQLLVVRNLQRSNDKRQLLEIYDEKQLENYEMLSNMTFGAAKFTVFPEKIAIVTYDMTRELSSEQANIECLLIKNENPNFNVCIHAISDDGYSKLVKQHGTLQPMITNMIRSFFDKYPNGTFLDLGANIGLYSLYAAVLNNNGQVVAVEPFPKNVIRIHKGAHLNKVQNRIQVVMAALSNSRGSVKFKEHVRDVAGNSLVRTDGVYHDGLTTNAILLDDLRHFVKTKKAILKIDIEGMECRAFANAEKIFDQVDILVISMEIEHTIKLGEMCFTKLLKFLSNRNYSPYHYPFLDEPLNYSKWRSWSVSDVYFKKVP